MITLCCVDISDGRVIPIDIDGNDLVGHLKDKIKEKNQYSFPAKDIQLRKVNGTLEETKEEFFFLYNEKKVPASDTALFDYSTKLLSSYPISYYFNKMNTLPSFIHVLVKYPPAAPVKISRHKHGEYKGMSVEASNRKYLDAVAQKVAFFFNFKHRFASNPTIGDVIQAKESKEWEIIPGKGIKTLDDYFTKKQWKILENMNRCTNMRIHDGRLRTTRHDKLFLVLPHKDMKNENEIKKIAQIVNLVTDVDQLLVEDEDNIFSGFKSQSKFNHFEK